MDKYARQMLFPFIGENGQKKLVNSSVLVVGVGALGTVISNQLVRAGVGSLTIVDRDYVEMTNLHRQILFDETDVKHALPKAIAARNKLRQINSDVSIEAFVTNVTKDNIYQFIEKVDVVLDGTDNFATRFLLNDICFKENIPFSYGGVVGSRGMTALFIPGETPCLRCITNNNHDTGHTCDTVGVISPAVDIVSSMQVTETLKYLTDHKDHLRHTMYTFDLWLNQTYHFKFSAVNEECPTCAKRLFPALRQNMGENEMTLCGRNTVQIHIRNEMNISLLEKKLEKVATIQKTPFLLKASFDNIQFVIFPDGRVLIQGTEDHIFARTMYDRYIGS